MTLRDWSAAAPLLGFHCLLLLNTYFSIRCFSSVATSKTTAQIAIDAILAGMYVYLAFQFTDPTRYLVASTVLFLIADIKYALVLGTPGYEKLLKRKMLLNLLAAVTCILALFGLAAGIHQSLGWWLAAFLLANVYLLGVSNWYFPIAEQAPSN